MDGAPVKGESIPIRVFLAGYDLTPTMRDSNKKFSVRYYLNLVLVDEEERRYFKQQEITLWRKAERPRKPYSLGGGPLPLQHAMARHQVARFTRTSYEGVFGLKCGTLPWKINGFFPAFSKLAFALRFREWQTFGTYLV
jgi:hypothetical protein